MGPKTYQNHSRLPASQQRHQKHEPIPTTDQLRHELKGSNRFSVIDITNCYHQFRIEPAARKLFTFRTPWGSTDTNEW